MANEFAMTDNSGTLKQGYQPDPVGEALKRKRKKLAENYGIMDNPETSGGLLNGTANS